MKIKSIDFPKQIVNALRDNKLVVFAGAGVSMGDPANLPSFRDLAVAIAHGTGDKLKDHEPEDQFLGRLEQNGTKVYERAKQVLSKDEPRPTELHRDLLRLYPKSKSPFVVTTNFDLLFKQAAEGLFDAKPEVYQAPALPLGREFSGIVHVHGALDRHHQMVLTDSDFGRAYLTEGWARRFLVELFRSFTVLFVGYSHNDTIMNYLSRALPVGETERRFALTPDAKDNRWHNLGIVPIEYIKTSDNDHSALHRGVHGLANHARRSILDWQREITEIAEKPPTLDEEAIDIIEDALTDESRTRFFTDAATSVEWVAWLDERNHLDGLFGTEELSEQDILLMGWLAEKFACKHSVRLFLLIGRHNLRLHPRFWLAICRTISLEEHDTLKSQTLSQWVSILAATAPAPYVLPLNKPVALRNLAERCLSCDDGPLVESIVEIFRLIAASHLVVKPGFLWPNADKEEQHPTIDVELAPESDQVTTNELWETGLRPFLDRAAEPLLESAIEYLTNQHRTLRTWHPEEKKADLVSYRRSAIEPHEQNRHPRTVDVLIDAARDCLEWLALNRAESAAKWCDQLISRDLPLLRRLAVHTLSSRNDASPDEKIEWLLARIGLHDFFAHHELFLALKETYPKADERRRRAVVEAIMDYRSPGDAETTVSHAESHQFNWLHWLNASAPDCLLAKESLYEVWKRNPEFQPREHPDLTYWIFSETGGHRAPWTVDELLSQPAGKWVEELLSFQETESREQDRIGLDFAVYEAAKRDIQWGFDLADALAERANWETDLWKTLIRTWGDTELDNNVVSKVFQQMERTQLHDKFASQIAEFLYKSVIESEAHYTHTNLTQANRIAANLWQYEARRDTHRVLGSWLTTAINDTAGFLAGFWLSSLSCWRKQRDCELDGLGPDYLYALSEIVRDKTIAGRLGRCVLARELSFLLYVDRIWTETNLIPFFVNRANVEDYQAIWDGLLYGHLSPTAAELMGEPFLDAVSRIEEDFSRQGQKQFISRYIDILGYFAHDPLEVWIPEFFKHAGDYARRCFANTIGNRLDQMTDSQQREWWVHWVNRYWEYRIQGVPAPLSADEIWIKLCWLPDLKDVFPEAVDLAVKMRPVESNVRSANSSRVVYLVYKNECWKHHPQAVAKLLLYLDQIKSRPIAWPNGKELIEELLRLDLSCEQTQSLREISARRGLI